MGSHLSFCKDKNGAAAVEFALIGSMLIMTILFILCVGLILFFGQSLDLAVSRASRQIMIGAVQTTAIGKDDFRTGYICANLPAVFDCSKVVVNVQTIAQGAQPGGYYGLVNSNQTALIIPTAASAQYAPGVQQSYVYVQAVYPITFLPASIAAILSGGTTYNGTQAVLLVSTAAFRNEQY